MNVPKPPISKQRHTGFTIVELLIVIVVIAILATVAIVAYRGVQQRAMLSTMSSDLRNAANAFELYKVDNNSYPTDMPASVKTSSGVVLSPTNAPSGSYCINAYNQNNVTLQASYDSKNGLQQNTLCSGAAIGGTAGGSVPPAARGTNIMSDFSQWTLTGTATYNSSTGELTLGTSGTARSPIVRVDSPSGMKVGGDMYATTASPYSGYAPQGGFHTGVNYYGSDGTTPVQNTAGYTSNGCARALTLNAWQTAVQTCGYTGGPNIIYMTFTLTGSNGGYASPDLKIKNPLLILN